MEVLGRRFVGLSINPENSCRNVVIQSMMVLSTPESVLLHNAFLNFLHNFEFALGTLQPAFWRNLMKFYQGGYVNFNNSIASATASSCLRFRRKIFSAQIHLMRQIRQPVLFFDVLFLVRNFFDPDALRLSHSTQAFNHYHSRVFSH